MVVIENGERRLSGDLRTRVRGPSKSALKNGVSVRRLKLLARSGYRPAVEILGKQRFPLIPGFEEWCRSLLAYGKIAGMAVALGAIQSAKDFIDQGVQTEDSVSRAIMAIESWVFEPSSQNKTRVLRFWKISDNIPGDDQLELPVQVMVARAVANAVAAIGCSYKTQRFRNLIFNSVSYAALVIAQLPADPKSDGGTTAQAEAIVRIGVNNTLIAWILCDVDF